MAKDNKKAVAHGNSVVLDPRFSRITSDLRFRPIKAKESTVSVVDDRFKNLKQKSSLHGNNDPRGRKFNIHNLGAGNRHKSLKGKQSSHKEAKGRPEEKDCGGEQPDSDDDADNNEAIDGFVDMDEDPDLLIEMDRAIELGAKDVNSESLDSRQQRRLQQLLDPSLDIARGVDQFSGESSSSSDDSSSSEEEQDEHYWGELDKDAIWDNEDQQVEETTRLAVCNIEWDLFKAEDILVVLQSFAPTGGKVLKVVVYISEFGKERKAEEEASGPKEIKDLPKVTDDDKNKDYETVRKYYINRLKYYYAVAECNSVDTARLIYKELDGHCFKNGGIVDLRYIPDDMTFDETPESESSSISKSYSNAKITDGFSGYNYVKTKYTWDDDDVDRKKTIKEFLYNADEAKDSPQLNTLLASDSEDNSDDNESKEPAGEVTAFTSEYESATSQPKSERIKHFKFLMENMHTINHAKEVELKLLARVLGDKVYENQPKWGEGTPAASDVTDKEAELTDEEDSEADESDDKDKDMSTFERYLLKRDQRQKEIKKAKKLQATGGHDKTGMEDDIPDELKDDPFFKEEFKQRNKEKLRREAELRREKDRELAKQEEERIQREKDLALLMLDDEDAGPRHFDMRELVKQAKEDASLGGKKKKLSRWKLAKLTAKAKRLAREGVELPASETELSVSIASSAAPVTAKTVVEDDRFSAIFKDHRANLDPSHPEFAKNRTPFMDSLIKEVQDKNVGATKRPVEDILDSKNKKVKRQDKSTSAGETPVDDILDSESKKVKKQKRVGADKRATQDVLRNRNKKTMRKQN